jgi:hypothetical protein
MPDNEMTRNMRACSFIPGEGGQWGGGMVANAYEGEVPALEDVHLDYRAIAAENRRRNQ